MKKIVIKENDANQRIDKYLKKLLCNAPSNFIYKMFRKKDIKINGKKVNEKYILQKDDILEMFLYDDKFNEFTKEKDIYDLKREFKVEANVGAPQVAYRETITQAADCEGKYVKQSGGRGQYGHVWIKFEPNEGKGFEFVDAIVGGAVPREYINSVKVGLEDALETGMIAGYPVLDVKATLFDGSYHDVDSSEMAYKVAASLALKNAAKKCGPVLLEPIMAVEVTAPSEYLGSVMGDISSRRGMIEGQEERGNAVSVQASVPLSEMFGYATDLRSFTQGRGNYTMQFDRYEAAPKSIREEIIKKNGGNV